LSFWASKITDRFLKQAGIAAEENDDKIENENDDTE
jgi:hypothetical protein